MRTIRFVLCVLLVCTAGCHRPKPENLRELQTIAGCWKGVVMSAGDRSPSLWNYFSFRHDSSLALSMLYEAGPRSRVWEMNADVRVQEGKISWKGHEGELNKAADTMIVTGEYEGERVQWRFVRSPSDDSLMAGLWASSGQSSVYGVPESLGDGWSCGDLSAHGIDKAKIVALVEQIKRGEHDDIHSFLIVKDGVLVVEEYFAMNGSRYGSRVTGLYRDRVHHLASTTKGITSALVGIAIDRGLIQSVEDPIHRYLPAYASLLVQDKQRIRICDMLTMTAGFEWRQFRVSEEHNDGMQMWRVPDVIRFVLEKPLEAEPGKVFNYTNGVPTVTGAIIRNAVRMEVRDFAEQFLFHPLGIVDYVWTTYRDGSIETDGGLALRSRDLAKIGQLFLDRGMWKGERIISEQWVRESTKERLRFGRSQRWGYGYHWMQADVQIEGRVVQFTFVPGDGNQILAVFPGLNMVVVFTAGNYGRDPKPDYASLFEESILPAVNSPE